MQQHAQSQMEAGCHCVSMGVMFVIGEEAVSKQITDQLLSEVLMDN